MSLIFRFMLIFMQYVKEPVETTLKKIKKLKFKNNLSFNARK